MKKKLYFLLILSYLSAIAGFSGMSETVNYEQAKTVASHKLISLQKSEKYAVIDHENQFIDSEGKVLFFVFELGPTGFNN